MKDTQISVYLANRPGQLAKMTSRLAEFGINIRAISVADSSEHGVVRMIVSDIERAKAALLESGYGFVASEVLTAEIPDTPGALAELCKSLADAGINIRYVYGTVTPGGGVALAVFTTDDNDRAEQIMG